MIQSTPNQEGNQEPAGDLRCQKPKQSTVRKADNTSSQGGSTGRAGPRGQCSGAVYRAFQRPRKAKGELQNQVA